MFIKNINNFFDYSNLNDINTNALRNLESRKVWLFKAWDIEGLDKFPRMIEFNENSKLKDYVEYIFNSASNAINYNYINKWHSYAYTAESYSENLYTVLFKYTSKQKLDEKCYLSCNKDIYVNRVYMKIKNDSSEYQKKYKFKDFFNKDCMENEINDFISYLDLKEIEINAHFLEAWALNRDYLRTINSYKSFVADKEVIAYGRLIVKKYPVSFSQRIFLCVVWIVESNFKQNGWKSRNLSIISKRRLDEYIYGLENNLIIERRWDIESIDKELLFTLKDYFNSEMFKEECEYFEKNLSNEFPGGLWGIRGTVSRLARKMVSDKDTGVKEREETIDIMNYYLDLFEVKDNVNGESVKVG